MSFFGDLFESASRILNKAQTERRLFDGEGVGSGEPGLLGPIFRSRNDASWPLCHLGRTSPYSLELDSLASLDRATLEKEFSYLVVYAVERALTAKVWHVTSASDVVKHGEDHRKWDLERREVFILNRDRYLTQKRITMEAYPARVDEYSAIATEHSREFCNLLTERGLTNVGNPSEDPRWDDYAALLKSYRFTKIGDAFADHCGATDRVFDRYEKCSQRDSLSLAGTDLFHRMSRV